MTNVREIVSLGAGSGGSMAVPRSPQGVCEPKVGDRSSPNMQIDRCTHAMHI